MKLLKSKKKEERYMIKTPNSLLYSQWDAMQLRNPTTHRTWKYNKKIKRKKERKIDIWSKLQVLSSTVKEMLCNSVAAPRIFLKVFLKNDKLHNLIKREIVNCYLVVSLICLSFINYNLLLFCFINYKIINCCLA